MTVNPGFGGQKFIPEMIGKIEKARKIIDMQKKSINLAVDGGINLDNISKVTSFFPCFVYPLTVISKSYSCGGIQVSSLQDMYSKYPFTLKFSVDSTFIF